MIHADAALARGLEAIICEEWRRLARTTGSHWPEKEATYLEVAGGVALWLGEGSLVNVAAGLAMGGPIGDAELRQMEDFYSRRGVPPILATCAFADPTLFVLLARRGWQVTEFENVLALELGAGGAPAAGAEPALPPRGIEARVCSGPERELWGPLAARGFNDDCEPGPSHEEFGALMAAREDAILVLGWVDGRPAGTGALVVHGDVGWLSGDSTLPEYRRRGVQQAIQRHRLQLAREAGCTLAVTESAPGSASQRNMERLGFRVVYTHLEFAKV
jgi:GNAT superfamily N-acetyltransferase